MRSRVDRNDLEDYLPNEYFIDKLRNEIASHLYWDFKDILNSSNDERPIQGFLERNPLIIASLLDGHLGRWVLSQKRLGSEFVTDFIVGDHSSSGMRWIAVELESPTKQMFNKSGDPSAKLTHAIRQILDWRSWLSDNKSYAQRKYSRGGLGLFGIRPKLAGYIFIGRSSEINEKNQERRQSMAEELNIHFCTYDWLLRRIALYSGNFDEIKL